MLKVYLSSKPRIYRELTTNTVWTNLSIKGTPRQCCKLHLSFHHNPHFMTNVWLIWLTVYVDSLNTRSVLSTRSCLNSTKHITCLYNVYTSHIFNSCYSIIVELISVTFRKLNTHYILYYYIGLKQISWLIVPLKLYYVELNRTAEC